MNTFIEQNRRLLRTYSIAAQIVGQVLLLMAAIVILVFLSNFIIGSEHGAALKRRPLTIITLIFPGLLILGAGQFIRYLLETDYKPDWLLRYGDKIFYLYAALLMANAIWGYAIVWLAIQSRLGFSFYLTLRSVALAAMSSLPFVVAKVFLLVGLGQILWRIIPLIEESRPVTPRPPAESEDS